MAGSASPEKAANRLVVAEATTDDNSSCGIHPATMARLSLFSGDVVLLKTGRGRTTACIALGDDTCEEHELMINRVVRSNLRARVADVVSVHPCNADIRDGRRVHVLPVDDTIVIEGVTGDLLQSYVRRYFHDAYRPVHKGDRFLVRGGGARSVEFKVVQIDDPAVEFCIVTRSTEIFCYGEPVGREEDEERLADDGVGVGGAQADDLDRQGAGPAAAQVVAPVFFPVYSHEAMRRGEYCAIRWIWH